MAWRRAPVRAKIIGLAVSQDAAVVGVVKVDVMVGGFLSTIAARSRAVLIEARSRRRCRGGWESRRDWARALASVGQQGAVPACAGSARAGTRDRTVVPLPAHGHGM